MSQSLQDQLLKAGAVKPKQAKKARREKAQEQAAARKGDPSAGNASLQTEIAAAEAAKRERDRQLNAERKARREAQEQDHAIGQIIERNRIEADGDVAYNYNLGNRIRRLAVSQSQQRDLAAGRLAIVRHRERAAIVPAAVGRRLMEKIPEQVWLVTAADEAPDPDDPYADYPVPDDLMW